MIKSRAASQGNSPTPPPQSIEAVRRRARHRLIGASILVLVGVVGFSLLFDTQPRPIAVDIPIEIPSKAAPLAPEAGARTAVAEPAATSLRNSVEASERAQEEPVAAAPVQAPAPAARPVTAAVTAPADPPRVLAPAPAPAPAPPPDVPSIARNAAPVPSAPAAALVGSDGSATVRLVVQVGAFAEPARAREVRQKIEAAGLKTYTHVAETSEGPRIRVRLGPFSSQAEADRVAARVKALGYPARILTL
ncbi:SPOR domain-containing protein [Hydrogenophaga sp.]|uniref:SPOR domain-containing protein n=1 Tax=Hydrogenophaga sp. TaxID=1904254 RepID=UPI0027209B02|nr:SPOR domain-containing protein [Hydrogenophaga sp.]MDO8902947.1 SPOR domain-containing protein [Hydrogenophaga sp.]